jgi:predicted HTH transcriptional regulator
LDRRSVLEQRVKEAVEFGLESPTVEFKESQPFQVLKYKLARTAQGMANNRDGGLIIIGFSERGGNHPNGVDDAVAVTYDYDMVYEFVNGYATPAIEFQMLTVVVRETRYIAIQVPPLGRTPTICRKDTPSAVTRPGERMAAGNIFVRTRDRIGTSPVTHAAMIDDLLQATASHRATELLHLLGTARLTLAPSGRQQYDKEVEDLGDYL